MALKYTNKRLAAIYSQDSGPFGSKKRQQIHNTLAKYYKEGSLDLKNKNVHNLLKKAAVDGLRGVKPQALMLALSPNNNSKLNIPGVGTKKIKASSPIQGKIFTGTIKEKNWYSLGNIPQSGHQRDKFYVSPKENKMMVDFNYIDKYGKLKNTGTHVYSMKKSTMNSAIYAAGNSKIGKNEFGEKTAGYTRWFYKNVRDVGSPSEKINFTDNKMRKDMLSTLDKRIINYDNYKPKWSTVKRVEKQNKHIEKGGLL